MAGKVAPYALRVSRLLRVVVPVAAALPGALANDDLKRVEQQLELLKAVAEQLPEQLTTDGDAERVRAEEGAGLRALRTLLLAQDDIRAFGDLRKVVTATGDILWVCPEHERRLP